MSRSLRAILNEGNPNKVPAAVNSLNGGTALALLPRSVQGAPVAAAGITPVANSDVLVLPENAKARAVLVAFAAAGVTTGYLTPVAGDGAPATTNVGVSPNGDILFDNATDDVTDAEVMYLPIEGPVVEDFVDVAASSATLLRGNRAVVLLEVEVLTGASPGAVLADERGNTPASGEAALNDTGLTVDFNAAQVVGGTARIRYIAQPGIGSAARSVGTELDAVDKDF